MLPTSDTMSRVKLAMQRVLADALPGVVPHPPRPAASDEVRPYRLSREEIQRLFGQELAGPTARVDGAPNVIALTSRRGASKHAPLVLRRSDSGMTRTAS